ncbi:MAG: GNAT family N-acetyltransferase [Lysobacterales bacterium]
MTRLYSARKPITHRRTGVWQEHLTLANGRELTLRPIQPIDQEPLRAAFSTLSPEQIRLRFLHPMNGLSPEYARSLTHLDPANAFALVATEPLPPGQALIGAVARLSFDRATGVAEFGLLVGRPLAGMGLGQYLMKKLMLWAKRQRLRVIEGDVLRENGEMLRLLDRLDFEHRNETDEPGVVRVWKNLQ